MARTRLRPTATGRISREDALGFGVILAIISVMVMGLAVNWVAAALLALTIAFYVFVYTMWLKRRTPQNIVIGGAAGAFPPMVGWAAVTGDVSLCRVLLFLIIFLWTPPHFWALALYRTGDYAAGRRADAAGGRRRERPAGTSWATRWCWCRSACCPGGSASPARSTASRRWRSAGFSSAARSGSGATGSERAAIRTVPALRSSTCSRCSPRWSRTSAAVCRGGRDAGGVVIDARQSAPARQEPRVALIWARWPCCST